MCEKRALITTSYVLVSMIAHLPLVLLKIDGLAVAVLTQFLEFSAGLIAIHLCESFVVLGTPSHLILQASVATFFNAAGILLVLRWVDRKSKYKKEEN